MSLFELRTEVDRHGGLSAAIAEYARTMGTPAACGCTCRWTTPAPGFLPLQRQNCSELPRKQ